MHLNYNVMLFQAFAAVEVESELFWHFTQHKMVVPYCSTPPEVPKYRRSYIINSLKMSIYSVTNASQLILLREGMAACS